MNLREMFKPSTKAATYYERRKGTLIVLYILMFTGLLFSTIMASGYIDGIAARYLPAGVAIWLAVTIAATIEWSKSYFLTKFVVENYKYGYADAILGALFLLCFVLTMFGALMGVSAKEAAEQLAEHERIESAISVTDSATTTAKTSHTTNHPPAPTLRAKTQFFAAVAAFESISFKKDSLAAAMDLQKDSITIAMGDKKNSIKGQIFKVNRALIITMEALFLLCAFGIGYIKSTEGATSTNDPIEVKKLKASYSTERARLKTNPNDIKAAERLKKAEEKLLSMGEELPEERV